MNAYHETLLPDVRSLLADAVDYAVIDLRMPMGEFLSLFAVSEWARRIERGDKTVILGLSGVELAANVLRDKTGRTEFPSARMSMGRSRAYWSGWILAFYQWHSNLTFKEILRVADAATIIKMYDVSHEAPDERFAEIVDGLVREKEPMTRLRRIRTAHGFSQAQLAERSGVGLRSIQMYEQRNKDINRAEAGSLLKLARTLGCEMEDLMEPQGLEG